MVYTKGAIQHREQVKHGRRNHFFYITHNKVLFIWSILSREKYTFCRCLLRAPCFIQPFC